MISNDTKICPICAESIKAMAKKCPHCHHWQTKWHTTIFHPIFGLVVIGIPVVVFYTIISLVMMQSWERTFGKGRNLAEYRDQIVVLESQMNYSVVDKKPVVSTVGKIKNNSNISWKDVQLEVQYYEKDGKLVDTYSERPFSISIHPGVEQAFRLRAAADKPPSAYASHRVFVRSAKDEQNWP